MARKSVYNKITSDENWSKVNPKNKELFDEFINYLKSVDKSNETIINYDSDLKIFFTWCYECLDNKFFVDLTKRDVVRYQNYLLNTLNLGSSRIRRLRSVLSSLSNYIENILDEDFPTFRNIINKIPAPTKNVVREKTVLSDEQIDSLLNHLVENKEYQKACVLALAMASGARKSELLRFKVSYFTEENIKYGSLYKTPEKIKTKGRGKGKMINKYIIVAQFKPFLDLWLNERQELGIESDDLFTINNISTLNSYAASFSKIAGIDFYWHSLRHYFTTALCKANIPPEVIKDVVGWQSIDLVSVYNDTEVDDELGKYFDVNGIKTVEQKSLSDL
jgi:integrase